MKVSILTEGGRGVGFGHLTRCLSLCQAFEEKGITPEFIINGDDSILDLLKRRVYKKFNWLQEEKRLLGLVGDVDIVVIDSYLAKKALYSRIFRTHKKCLLVMMDDYKRIDYPEGIVVNPSIYGDKLDYLKKKGVRYLLGKDYIILRKEFWDLPKKVINKNLENIVVTLGGMDCSSLICRMQGPLRENFDLNLNIIEPKKKFMSANKIRFLMFRCDACISGSGQTTYELARIGVPNIGICLSENQRINAEMLRKKGVMEYIGGHKDRDLLKNLGLAIEKLSSQKIRIKMSMAGRRLVDGQGPRRIVRKVLKYADKN